MSERLTTKELETWSEDASLYGVPAAGVMARELLARREEVGRQELLLESANHARARLVAALRPLTARMTKMLDDEGDPCGGEYGCTCGYIAAVHETETAAAVLDENAQDAPKVKGAGNGESDTPPPAPHAEEGEPS